MPLCSKLNVAIGRSYWNLGKHDLAKIYKNLARKDIDNYVKEEMEVANKYFENLEFILPKSHYKHVLKYKGDTTAKNRLKKCEGVLELGSKRIMEIKREVQKKRKRKERKLQWEKQKIFWEEQKKKMEEAGRKRKEE